MQIPSISTRLVVDLLEFNERNWEVQTYMFGEKLIRGAGRAFCREVYKNVPVWSGMALGSLRPLARAVHFPMTIIPRPEAPDRRREGSKLGAKPIDINRVGASRNDVIFSFNWTSDVYHFALHDQRNMRLKNPNAGYTMEGRRVFPAWHAIEQGMRAAGEYIDKNIHKVPIPTAYSVYRHVEFDPDRGGSFEWLI